MTKKKEKPKRIKYPTAEFTMEDSIKTVEDRFLHYLYRLIKGEMKRRLEEDLK